MRHSISGCGVEVSFDAKPPAAVLACLKTNGFRWNRRARAWHRRKVAGAADVLAALDKLLSKGQPRTPDVPCWKCGDPAGFLRNRGASAPVLCDRCVQKAAEADARRMAEDDFDQQMVNHSL